MDMNENEWIWLMAGLIPYRIERKVLPQGKRILTVQALFWTFAVHGCRGQRTWVLRVPLIERLRDAVWAAVLRLGGKEPPQS
jgi:hypothetical protein